MANDDLKRIKEFVEIIKHKVDMLEMGSRTQTTELFIVKDRQSLMNEKLDILSKDVGEVKETQGEHTKRLAALAGDMEQVLSEVRATHDEIGLWHQRDKREIDQIKKHVGLPLIPDRPQ